MAVFRLQGNLPFNPKPKNPDDWGTFTLLSGDICDCISPISILSAIDIGTGMGPGTGGAGKLRFTPPAACCKGDDGYSIPAGRGAGWYPYAFWGALCECLCERVWRRERDSLPAFVTSAGACGPPNSGARPANSGKGANCCCCSSSRGGFGRGLLRLKLSMNGIGKLRCAYSGLRRPGSQRRCALLSEEGGEFSGD